MSRDVYVLWDRELDLRTRCEAGLVAFPSAMVCLETAALLLKLPVDDDGFVHLLRGLKAPRLLATQQAGRRATLTGGCVGAALA